MFTNSYTINNKNNYTYLSKVHIKIDNDYYYNKIVSSDNLNFSKELDDFHEKQNKLRQKIKNKKN